MDSEQENIDKSFHDYWKKRYDEAALKCEKDSDLSLASEHSANRRMTAFSRVFKKHLFDKKRILDVGCGSGAYVRMLAALGHDVTGVDHVESMINVAISKSKGKNINYNVASVYSLPYKDNSFDIVVCIGVLQHICDVQTAINEIKRVLKENEGILVLITLNSLSIRIFYRKLLSKLSLLSSRNNASDNYVEIRYNPLKLKNVLRSSGFDKIEVKNVYVFPKTLKIFETPLNNDIILQIADIIPFSLLFAHEFLIKAVKADGNGGTM